MDEILRETMLAGMTPDEITQLVGREIQRRGMCGLLFFHKIAGKQVKGHLCIVVPPTIRDLPLRHQVMVFAEEIASGPATIVYEEPPDA